MSHTPDRHAAGLCPWDCYTSSLEHHDQTFDQIIAGHRREPTISKLDYFFDVFLAILVGILVTAVIVWAGLMAVLKAPGWIPLLVLAAITVWLRVGQSLERSRVRHAFGRALS